MIFDRKRPSGDGVWHCPFTQEWLDCMKNAQQKCKKKNIKRKCAKDQFHLSCLKEPQDARGLPMSYCEEQNKKEEEQHWRNYHTSCNATYNYSTIPDIVATNGEDDWPFRVREKLITL